jgi:dienelactone hydrolase
MGQAIRNDGHIHIRNGFICRKGNRQRTVVDQSQLGRLNMILDLYRSLAVLAAHPRVDPNRIAVMGFSRGGQATLYASLKRFHKMWNAGGIDPAAYIALYPPCITTYIGDTEVSDHPIRMFHGISDDYVEIAPCEWLFRSTQTDG